MKKSKSKKGSKMAAQQGPNTNRSGTIFNNSSLAGSSTRPTTSRPVLDPNSVEAQYLEAKKQQLHQGYSTKKIDNTTAALASAWGQFRADNAKLKTEGYDYHTIKDEFFGKPVLPTTDLLIKVSGPKGSIVDAKPADKELQEIRVRAKAPASGIYDASQQYNVDQRVDELAKSLVAKGVDVVALEKKYSTAYASGSGTNQSGTDDILAASADAGRRVIDGQRRTRGSRSQDASNQGAGTNQPASEYTYAAPTTTLEQRRDAYIRNAMKGTVRTYVENGGPNAGKTITVMFPSGSTTGGGELDPAYEKVGLNVRQLAFSQSDIDPEGYFANMGMQFVEGVGWSSPGNPEEAQKIKDNYTKTKGVWNNLTGQYDKVGADGSIIPSPPLPRNADGSYAIRFMASADIPVNNSPNAVDTSWVKKPDITPEQADKNLAALYDSKGILKSGVTSDQVSKAIINVQLANNRIVVDNGMAFSTISSPFHTEAYALSSPENLRARGFVPGYYSDSQAEALGPDALGHYQYFKNVLGADGQYWTTGPQGGATSDSTESPLSAPTSVAVGSPSTDGATPVASPTDPRIAQINASSASQEVKDKALLEVASGHTSTAADLIHWFEAGQPQSEAGLRFKEMARVLNEGTPEEKANWNNFVAANGGGAAIDPNGASPAMPPSTTTFTDPNS